MRAFLASISVQIKNSFLLGLVSLANVAVPLVLIGHLTRTMSVEVLAVALLATSMASLLASVSDYGFAWSATRQVSVHRADSAFVERVFFEVFCAKAVVCAAIGAVLAAVLLVNEQLAQHAAAYGFSYLFMLGTALQPLWFYQGMERVREVTGFIVAFRLLALGLILVLVDGDTDLHLFLGIYAASNLACGLVMFAMALRREVRWRRPPSIGGVLHQLREGWNVFQALLAASVYSMFGVFVIDQVLDARSVAVYAAGERLVRGSCQLIAPVSQAFFPHAAKALAEDPGKGRRTIVALALLSGVLIGCGSVLMFLLAEPICHLLYSDRSVDSGEVAGIVRLMAPLPAVLMVGTALSTWYMLGTRAHRAWRWMALTALVVFVAACGSFIAVDVRSPRPFAVLQVVVELYVLAFAIVFFILSGRRAVRRTDGAAGDDDHGR